MAPPTLGLGRLALGGMGQVLGERLAGLRGLWSSLWPFLVRPRSVSCWVSACLGRWGLGGLVPGWQHHRLPSWGPPQTQGGCVWFKVAAIRRPTFERRTRDRPVSGHQRELVGLAGSVSLLSFGSWPTPNPVGPCSSSASKHLPKGSSMGTRLGPAAPLARGSQTYGGAISFE